MYEVFVDVDGVFEVEVVEGYDGDGDVLFQCQLFVFGCWVVGDDLVDFDFVIYVYDGVLVEVGVLVGVGKVDQFKGVDVVCVYVEFVVVFVQCYLNGVGVYVVYVVIYVVYDVGV